MRKKQGLTIVYILLILLFLVLALVSGWKIFDILADYRAEENTSKELQQYITPVTVPPATEPVALPTQVPEEIPVPTEAPYPYPVVDFAALQEINDDVIGWIQIEGTKINYPIVQGKDNQRYINHMADGKWNPAGSIFMDYRNEADFSDVHTVLYGHNMRNGSMFAGIMDYKKKGFLEEHPTGVILTPEKNFRFEVVSGYVAQVTDPAWQLYFESDEDYEAWRRKTMKRSVIGGEFALEPTDRFITLSTCSYEFDDARFVLVCRIIE